MTPEQLRTSIYQSAIQGKLVEQNSCDTEVDKLFSDIIADKKTLIEQGLIKKEKTLDEIDDDEKPFDIPATWMWMRFGDVVRECFQGINTAGNHTKFVDSDGVPIIQTGDMSNGEISLTSTKLMSWADYDLYKDKYQPRYNDIFYCNIGTIGKPLIYRDNYTMLFHWNIFVIRYNEKCIIPEYLKVYLEYITDYFKAHTDGTAMQFVSKKKILNVLFPLPPIEEQQRIVSKIEELLPFVYRYAEAYEKLEKFNAKFPEDMKKSILQYAIQGKLVEQREEEGTAEKLYQQIQDEKAKLIKEGKIKKEKPLGDITDDEIPFDIPDSWKWVRVGDLFSHNTGKAMNSSAKTIDKVGAIRKFITTSNVYWNMLDLSTVKEMFFSDDELERCTIKKGDMLMCEGGAYYGRTAIWTYDYEICFQNHVHRLRNYGDLVLKFYYYVFYFYRNTGMMQSKGTAMPGLSSIVLHEIIIPLPPLEEQKRIVAKIEELMPYCDMLIK